MDADRRIRDRLQAPVSAWRPPLLGQPKTDLATPFEIGGVPRKLSANAK
jgi:hypothetical protein